MARSLPKPCPSFSNGVSLSEKFLKHPPKCKECRAVTVGSVLHGLSPLAEPEEHEHEPMPVVLSDDTSKRREPTNSWSSTHTARQLTKRKNVNRQCMVTRLAVSKSCKVSCSTTRKNLPGSGGPFART